MNPIFHHILLIQEGKYWIRIIRVRQTESFSSWIHLVINIKNAKLFVRYSHIFLSSFDDDSYIVWDSCFWHSSSFEREFDFLFFQLMAYETIKYFLSKIEHTVYSSIPSNIYFFLASFLISTFSLVITAVFFIDLSIIKREICCFLDFIDFAMWRRK